MSSNISFFEVESRSLFPCSARDIRLRRDRTQLLLLAGRATRFYRVYSFARKVDFRNLRDIGNAPRRMMNERVLSRGRNASLRSLSRTPSDSALYIALLAIPSENNSRAEQPLRLFTSRYYYSAPESPVSRYSPSSLSFPLLIIPTTAIFHGRFSIIAIGHPRSFLIAILQATRVTRDINIASATCCFFLARMNFALTASAFSRCSLFSDLRSLAGTTLMNLLAALFMVQLLFIVGAGGVQVSLKPYIFIYHEAGLSHIYLNTASPRYAGAMVEYPQLNT